MNELMEKSIRTLELPRILELLTAEAVSSEAKERARSLEPSPWRAEVERLQAETTAACDRMRVQGAPYFSGIKPIHAAIQRAQMGGTLSTRELLDIAGVLRAARTTKEYGSEDRREPTVIDALFQAIQANRYLEDRIGRTILSEEEIADSASPELADIRRHMRAAVAKVREVLQRMISSSHYSKLLQESIITMRNGRYVVPVKAEYRSAVPGLVHDMSASGATVFIEPMSAVQANNELRELELKEQKEIDRILAELSAEAAGHGEDILRDYGYLVELDLIFARGKLAQRMNAMPPKLSEDRSIVLRRARHPLLDRETAVPIDIRLGGDFDAMVITGPNTGGKTVTLKTLGLLCLMAQCGLHLPTGDGSQVPVFRAVLADIGDEQSIEQSLSTFSAHMRNIVQILEQADGETLTLFDELGAGTDPVEGAALAVSVIQQTRRQGALVAATTHYAELKVFAMTTPGVCNASCEFDVETLQPTYRLLIGVPGKSNAFAIARRLGLPEEVLSRAREQLDTGSLRFEDVLTQMEAQRQAMEKERREVEVLRQQAREDRAAAAALRGEMQEQRDRITEKARQEAREILEDARGTADSVFAELSEMRKRQSKGEDWQSTNEARAALRRRLNEAEDRTGATPEEPEIPPMIRPAEAGDKVKLLTMGGAPATVLEVLKDGNLRLQAGAMTLTARQEDVRVTEQTPPSARRQEPRTAAHDFKAGSPAVELDLRGMTADEALALVDQFLDRASLSHMETARIIHGKGTGVLRNAVRTHLRSSRYVKSFRPGRYGEGEDGVTVVTLK